MKPQRQVVYEYAPATTSVPCLLQCRYRYDAVGGQLEAIHDSRRGPIAYRYDTVHLQEAVSGLGKETFAFDPAGNSLDPKTRPQEALAARVANIGNSKQLDHGDAKSA